MKDDGTDFASIMFTEHLLSSERFKIAETCHVLKITLPIFC